MANKKVKKKNAKLQTKKQPPSFKAVLKVCQYSVISLLVFGAIGVSAYYGQKTFKQFLAKPIASVAIEGDFVYMRKETIANIINSHIKGSFIRESLKQMQEQIKSNPWIDSVTLRRQWPDQLQVRIVEQKPIARWGDSGFVNYRGELIKVDDSQLIQNLPILRGDEINALAVMKQYQVLSQAISAYHINIVELEENELGIWTLYLDNGWKLLAGRTDVVKKVQQVMQMLAENKILRQNEINTIDMRYENGLAIKWKTVEQLEQHARRYNISKMDNSEQNI